MEWLNDWKWRGSLIADVVTQGSKITKLIELIRVMLHGVEMSWLIRGSGCMAHRIIDDVAHMAIQKLIFLDKEGRWIQDKVSLR